LPPQTTNKPKKIMKIKMNYLSAAVAASLALCATANAAVIAVMDGGGPGTSDSSHTTVIDLSTVGDSIGAMTGSFTSDASNWRSNVTNTWNNTEWAFQAQTGNTATWTFSNMAVGSQWDVYGTWAPNSNRSTVVPYTIQGGSPIKPE
jgi:hypothetical protein